MAMNLRRKLTVLPALASTLLFGGCSSDSTTNAGDDYADGAPELAAVQMRVTGDSSSEGLATPDDDMDPQAIAADELATVAGDAGSTGTPDLNGAREAVRDLNQTLRASLQSIAALVKNTQPTYKAGDVRMWGPVVRGDTEFRFFMRRPAPRDFQWRLDARVAGTATAYSHVAAGEIALGARVRRGVGVAGFDLDKLSAVDPTVTAQGKILAGFAHGPLATTLAFGLKNFTRDPAVKPGIDALLQEVHFPNEVNRVRLAYHGNVEGTATDAPELVLVRIRHSKGIGGRADMIVESGDVPEGHAWVINQCWSAALDQTYRVVHDCPLDGIGGDSCTQVSVVGDVGTCDVNLRQPELPPADPNQTMTDAQDPNSGTTPPPPTDIPDVSGEIPDAG
jgi:hypothetical protein